MQFNDINEDSKYLYYVADNASQYTDMNTAFDVLGGTKFLACEYHDVINPRDWAIIIAAMFLVTPPRKNIIRCFLGHGPSNKPIAKFDPPQSFTVEDYYFSAGLSQAWTYEYYRHQLGVPYKKEIKIGIPASDYLINKEYCKKSLKFKYGIKTDRPIVLFSPTFQSKSLEWYYRLFVEAFKEDYFFIVRRHDREMFFDSHKYPNLFQYRGLNHPNELIALADYYIGDGSSVDNLAIYKDIPMVMVRPVEQIQGATPYEFDIRNYCPYFSVDAHIKVPTILDKLKEAESEEWKAKRHEYIGKNFWFNDGKCTDRWLNALRRLVQILKKRKSGCRDRRMEMIMTLWKHYLRTVGGQVAEPTEKVSTDIEYDELFSNLES